jgi:hypothetical protein
MKSNKTNGSSSFVRKLEKRISYLSNVLEHIKDKSAHQSHTVTDLSSELATTISILNLYKKEVC